MNRKRRRPEALEAAWRIHSAQSDWTSKVDAKAVFALTFEAAAIAVGLTLARSSQALVALFWWQSILFWAGTLSLVVAAGVAALVVTPQLRSKRLKREERDNFIYFGHVRHWSGDQLRDRLIRGDELDQVTRQIVVMAGIAWKKHVLVQWSFAGGVVGAALLVAFSASLLR